MNELRNRPSSRAAIANFLAMEMAREAAARAAAGERIIRFDVGQPCFSAPPEALAAVRAKLDRDALGYTEALGAAALRARIARHYDEAYGLVLSPERIIITTGASGAFTLAFLALFESGDRVAMAAPGYPPYRHILTALGMRAALAQAGANDRLQLQARHIEDLAAQAPLAGVLLASPANPTGAMLTDDELAALAACARGLNLPLISDEIYHGLTYERPATSALAVDPDAIIINSFSKYWAMTGWRVGWIVAPPALVAPIERLAQNLTVSPPHISQIAALAALDAGAECERRRALYARNRAHLLATLPELGLTLAAPADGAFYMLVDVSAHSDDSLAFCKRALVEAGVALTTGVDFDEARGRHWMRIAYARAPEEVEEGVARLRRWLAGA
ncbi:MAG: aminotransferase class I/II-fold pyridoxal phosphate-dependent enzyme [Hydrogenophilaceae bacterium]|jgi:aspartate/methionine/tyrosine aminotransferase|nr:aminotransferase class I/II-fold pyridoxal phosphate-dependent enzyme [Hydrogenophilaceae bacterium]